MFLRPFLSCGFSMKYIHSFTVIKDFTSVTIVKYWQLYSFTRNRGNSPLLHNPVLYRPNNNIWNSLSDSVVDADTIYAFKNRLDRHWLDQDAVFNFHSELTGTGGASICM